MIRMRRRVGWTLFALALALLAVWGLVRERRIAAVATLDCTVDWRGTRIVVSAANGRKTHELLAAVLANHDSLDAPQPGGEPMGLLSYSDPGSNDVQYRIAYFSSGGDVALFDPGYHGATRDSYLELKTWRTLEYYLGQRRWWDRLLP